MMIVHTKTNPENLRLRMAGKLLLTAMFFWIWSVPLTLAQTGGLGCLVDAGISPQEVCIEDHVFLGGTPTIPSALAGEVSSIQWSVVSPDIDVELAIYVPTAFTPNQDALNEVWKPVISGVQRIDQYHLQVFSRWGQFVFETSVPGEGWDALNVPRQVVLEDSQNSVFAYLINILPDVTVNEPDPDWIELRGHVTIVD